MGEKRKSLDEFTEKGLHYHELLPDQWLLAQKPLKSN